MHKKRSRLPKGIEAAIRRLGKRLGSKGGTLSKTNSSTKISGWFHEQVSGIEFYTPFSRTETRRHVPGPGDRMPTPREVVDKLEELGGDCYFSDSGYFVVEPDAEIKSEKEKPLPGGSYVYEEYDGSLPERLVPTELRVDGFVKTSMYHKVKDHVRSFINDADIFKAGGSLYKCGIMLYGPPGEGKTSCLRNLIKEEIPADAVILFCSGVPTHSFLKKMRETLKDRLKVIVFEEMLTVVSSEKRLEKVLDFLDGEQSLDYMLVLGTTNYPERLPGNIVDRPGRFDELYKFGHPKKDDLKNILAHYLGKQPTESETKVCEGLSSAAIQQACILAKRKSITLEQATAVFKKRSELVRKDFAEQKQMGMGMSRLSMMLDDDE